MLNLSANGGIIGKNGIFLFNNGGLSATPLRGGKNVYQHQKSFLGLLDSLGGSVTTVYLNKCVQSGTCPKIIQRHGNFTKTFQTIENIIQRSHRNIDFVIIPVINWPHLNQESSLLPQLFQRYPHTRFILVDYSEECEKQAGILNLDTSYQNSGNRFFHFNLAQTSDKTGQSIKIYKNEILERNIELSTSSNQLSDSNLSQVMSIPVSSSFWNTGYCSYPALGPSTPYSNWHFSYPPLKKMNIIHIGRSFISLPSIGKPNHFISIRHADDLKGSLPLKNEMRFDAIFIFNANIPSDYQADRLFAYVRSGGTLVLGMGLSSDISRINRRLLMPGRVGYITRIRDEMRARHVTYLPGPLFKSGFQQATKMLQNAQVYKQFQFTKNQETEIILQSKSGPILLQKKIGKGQIILWTTDLDDINWTTLGSTAFIPLFHQYIISGGAQTNMGLYQTVSDSLFQIKNEALSRIHPDKVRVMHDSGNSFHAMVKKGSRIIVGPFDRTGIYKVFYGSDSLLFAVNLKRQKEEKKDSFISKIGQSSDGRFTILTPSQIKSSLSISNAELWKWGLILALLCILAECLVTRFISPPPSRPSNNPNAA